MEHFYKNIQGWFDYEKVYSDMVSYFPSGSHFVEIGSWKGCSTSYMAVEIINSGKQIKFDCVDTWLGSDEHREGYFRDEDAVGGKLYDVFLKNMEPVRHAINPIRLTSTLASKLYEDNSLDFVFIDGDHDYWPVYVDIIHWYPKVKPGGFIGGHDFNWPTVEAAVTNHFNDFAVTGVSWLKQKT